MITRSIATRPTLDRSFDRSFEQLVNSFFDTRRTAGPVVDAAWQHGDRDEYVLTVDLPGVPASAVTVEVSGTTLTLGAHTDSLEWQRSLRLGGRLDPEKVAADHVDGRLTVRIGTIDEPVARRIEIATTRPEPAPAIEAESADAPSAADDQPNDTNSAG